MLSSKRLFLVFFSPLFKGMLKNRDIEHLLCVVRLANHSVIIKDNFYDFSNFICFFNPDFLKIIRLF